jgi:type I restriction enzyme, S subunit
MEVFDKKIGDLVEYIVDNRGKTPPLAQEGYELIETTSIVGQNKYPNYDKISKFVDENTYNNWFRKGHPKAGDILIATVGANIGNISIMRKDRGCVAQNLVALRTNSKIADADFLYYFLSSEDNQRTLKKLDIGAAQPSIKVPHLLGTVVRVPDVMTQLKIATILSAYDDLIENNLRRIIILEEMVQNLYREWFVNFRFPGHEKARFVDSPLGKIPEGWEAPFSEHVDFKEGPGLRNWQYRDHGIPFLNIRTLVNNDVDFSKVNYLDEIEVKNKYQHFLLKEFDHVVSSSGTLGRLVTIRSDHLPLMLNTSIIRMRPISFNVGRWQLKHFLLSDYFQNQARSFATGSAQANFGPSHLSQMFIVSPPEEISSMYENVVDTIEMAIISFVRRNKVLCQTRDLLLPKLISGEVDVTELDIFVPEEAAS